MLAQFVPQEENLETIKKGSKIIGGFSLKNIPKYVAWSFGLVTIYTYYVATILTDEVPPFPHCTITATATPYPQNIAFRFVILPQLGSTLFLYIAQYYIFKYAAVSLKKQGVRGIFDSCCTLKFFVYLVIISWACIGMAVATIDSYKMNDKLHGASAVVGFVGLFLSLVMINKFYKELLPYNPNIVSEQSLNYKKAVVKFQTGVLIYVIQHILGLVTFTENKTMTDWETSLLEYTVFYSLVFYIYSFSYDFKDFYFFFSLKTLLSNDLEGRTLENVIPVMGQIDAFIPQQPQYQHQPTQQKVEEIQMTNFNGQQQQQFQNNQQIQPVNNNNYSEENTSFRSDFSTQGQEQQQLMQRQQKPVSQIPRENFSASKYPSFEGQEPSQNTNNQNYQNRVPQQIQTRPQQQYHQFQGQTMIPQQQQFVYYNAPQIQRNN